MLIEFCNFIFGWAVPLGALAIGAVLTVREHRRHMAEVDAGMWEID